MAAFTWRDGERTIIFGEGLLDRAPQLLADNGFGEYDLLTTSRALATAPPELPDRAREVHHVAKTSVPEAAGAVIGNASGDLVAYGGGRVVDVAKGIAAGQGGRVAAIPTTLAGSPITAIHKIPAGHESEFRGFVRCALVLADPESMTSPGEIALRATAMNALAHASESLYAPGANPVAEMAALRGAELIGRSLDTDRVRRDRGDLALGAVLGAYAIGSTGLAMHHAVCQTLVKVLGLPHAETNAAMLPHTMSAMTHRAPRQIAQLAGALGTSAGALGARISELAGGSRQLSDLGVPIDKSEIDSVLDALDERGDVYTNTPDPPDREELRALISGAW